MKSKASNDTKSFNDINHDKDMHDFLFSNVTSWESNYKFLLKHFFYLNF